MTTTTVATRLQVGGTLGPDHVYVVRAEDKVVFDLLVAGEYCNILTSRQMGKSSLMVRTKAKLLDAGVRVVQFEMAGDIGRRESHVDWYVAVLRCICAQLDFVEVDVETWWSEKAVGTPNQRLMTFFRDVLLSEVKESIVVFVDEIDQTLELPYTDDFFLALRTMYNNRATEPQYTRLTFCLIGVASVAELIKGRRVTPYNIGKTIPLRDFNTDIDDLRPITDALDARGLPGQEILDVVMSWTSGHPFLTMALCEMAADNDLRNATAVEDAVERMVGAHRQVRPLASSHLPNPTAVAALKVHFDFVNTFLTHRLQRPEETLRLYRKIVRDKKVEFSGTVAQRELQLSGVVRRHDEGYLAVRNRLYERRFNTFWVDQTKAMQTSRRFRLRVAFAFVASTLLIVAGFGYKSVRDTRLQAERDAREKQERTAEIEKRVEELKKETREPRARELQQAICALFEAGSYDARVRTHAEEAWGGFWSKRAEQLYKQAFDLVQQGQAEQGLVLAAFAAIRQPNTLPKWVNEQYVKVHGPELIATLRGHSGPVSRVRFVAKDRVVSLGTDGTLRLYDTTSASQINQKSFERLAQTMDVDLVAKIVLIAAKGAMELLSLELQPQKSFPLLIEWQINGISFSPTFATDERIALATDDKHAVMFSFGPRFELSILDHLVGTRVMPVSNVRVSPDGRLLFSAAYDGVRRFVIGNGSPGKRIPWEGQAFDLRLSKDGGKLLIAGENASAVYDLESSTILSSYRKGRLFFTATFSPDEKWVINAARTQDNKALIAIWNAASASGTEWKHYEPNAIVRDAVFGLDDKPTTIASAHEDGTVRVWSLEMVQAARSDVERWNTWQRKFGYTVDDDDQVIAIQAKVAMTPQNRQSELCK